MKTFRIADPREWKRVEPMKGLEMSVKKARLLRLSLMVSDFTEVYLHHETLDDPVLVGIGQGRVDLETRLIPGDNYLQFVAGEKAEVFYRRDARDQIPAVAGGKRKFTELQPKRRRNTEFDKMARLMQLNNERNQQLIQQSLERERATSEALRAATAQAAPVQEATADPQEEVQTDDES